MHSTLLKQLVLKLSDHTLSVTYIQYTTQNERYEIDIQRSTCNVHCITLHFTFLKVVTEEVKL
jgi:hypothetical protein